jgi:hypothetical protein
MLAMTRTYDHYTRVEYDAFSTTHKFRFIFIIKIVYYFFGFYCNGDESLQSWVMICIT